MKVKIHKNGYLVNDTEFIVRGSTSPLGLEVEKWLENNTPEPEFTDEELVEKEDNKKIVEYKTYLKDTDWYYARKLETGEDVPTEVISKRVEAREFLRSKGY